MPSPRVPRRHRVTISAYLSSVGRLCGKLVMKLDRGVLQLLHCLCCLRTVPGSCCFLV